MLIKVKKRWQVMETIIKNLQRDYKIIGREKELRASLIAAKAGKHILLEGAVGVGKTTIALAVASHLKRKVIRIDGDERYTEQKLAGWFDPPLVLSRGYTIDSFIYGPLASAMIEGAILLINELNRMPEGTQNVLLTAMDEKMIQIPKFGRVDAKDGFLIIATQNPEEYIGTSQLSEALKDRFICITLNYQTEEEEREIVKLRSRCNNMDIINVAVKITRGTRENDEIRRGSSIRGAIDLADIFYESFGSFNSNVENWLESARLSFLTKIELQDFTDKKFTEIIKKLIIKSLDEFEEEKIKGFTGPGNSNKSTVLDQERLNYLEKKKSRT